MTLDAEGGETETSGLLPEAAGGSGTMPSRRERMPQVAADRVVTESLCWLGSGTYSATRSG